MKKFTKLTFFTIAIIMLLQIFLPTISLAITLGIQYERPYNDDDGDGKTGNDIYTIKRDATQTVFKIGEKTGDSLNFNTKYSYYCLRAGLGFGTNNVELNDILSGDKVYDNSLNELGYVDNGDKKLQNKDNIIDYYKNTLGWKKSDDDLQNSYKAICWIVDNMYLPKSDYAGEMKTKLLQDAGITSSQLKDDDIEVIQQVALWYFANYDTNGQKDSLSLADSVDLANLLQISGFQPSNNTQNSYNKIRAEQINKLYKYFIDNANEEHTNLFEEKNLTVEFNNSEPSIVEDVHQTHEGEQQKYNYLIGPYSLNVTQTGNINFDANNDLKFNYYINGVELTKGNVKLVDGEGKEIVNKEKILDGSDFYVRITERSNRIIRFNLKLSYKYSYYNTEASILTAELDGNIQQPVLKVEKTKQNPEEEDNLEVNIGYYKLQILKIDSENNKPLKGAVFTINGEKMPATGEDGTFTSTEYRISELDDISHENDVEFTINETNAPDGYEILVGPITLQIDVEKNNNGYYVKNAGLKEENENAQVTIDENTNTIIITVKNKRIKEFDLSLRKYITKVNGEDVKNTRIPDIDTSKLNDGTSTTAEYAHRKDPVEVKTGDLVTYNLTVYNEGEIAGRATKIVDQLPAGLEFKEVIEGNYEVESYNKETNTLTLKEKEGNNNLAAYNGEKLESTTVTIVCEVTEKVSKEDKVLTNVAWIAQDFNAENNEIKDRDSKPEDRPDVNKDNMTNYTGKDNKEDLSDANNYYKGEQDDDDFEKVIIRTKEFDLSLRKYISDIERNGQKVEFENRTPSVDTTPLKEGETTARYTHPKDTLTVKQGDIITYTIRVYNEGGIDGKVEEITDYIPAGLGLICENNIPMGANWLIAEDQNVAEMKLVGEDGLYKENVDVPNTGLLKDKNLDEITIAYRNDNEKLVIKDSSLKDEEITKYDAEKDVLSYKDIEVTCVVLAPKPNTYDEKIINIAEISESSNKFNIPERDSEGHNVDLENYELKDENSTYQEDDDDYEPIELKYFDLALRKFITGVNEEEITSREPQYKDEDGKILTDAEGNIVYKYGDSSEKLVDKEDEKPLEVADKDIVTYTIRVYNEGILAGFAEEIEDDIPEGLIFLPENETNLEYGWKMYYYDEEGKLVETEDVTKAEVIRTDYLSEANGKIDEETEVNSNSLKAFDGDILDYRDVQVAFKVSQYDIPAENEDKIIINKAHITKDSDDDEDSIPDKWNDGEDDQDIEKVHVQEFDLALFKWVSATRVTVEGKTTVTETGFKPNIGHTEASGDNYRANSDEEPIAKVEVHRKKIYSTNVKFVYTIMVRNEGDIAGYVNEITDYIPEGLEFIAEDNPIWTIGEKDGTITTRALENEVLKPGESVPLQVVFTWKNDPNNFGIKANIAAITEDGNDKNVEDIDSVPGNENMDSYDKEQEDDDDIALVMLSLGTGSQMSYLGITLAFIAIIAAGTITIKKYVL